MLASGGDSRITVPRGANTNRYGASPFPRATLGYAASTANDISLDAYRHLEAMVERWPPGGLLDAAAYRAALELFRTRLRAAWSLPADTAIVFAPSGTDLEFVALALARASSGEPVTNILLGQDEVGSGCAFAAAGRHFADETALSQAFRKGQAIEGLGDTRLIDVPVRDRAGLPVSSAAMAVAIGQAAAQAQNAGRHPLAHVVHGSKTGLVLPELGEIDRLRASHSGTLTLVVDACQARIEPNALRAYLDRDSIVLLTGSKFIGGPPFSGIALVPAGFRPRRALPPGLAAIFRRAEWPQEWSGCDHLPEGTNPGLLLRLAAALFELERFAAIAADDRARVIARFGAAVRDLATRLGADLVAPALAGGALHTATLATLDLSRLPGRPDFATAQRWCQVLAARGMRLGQPVRCVRDGAGGWAGTLRLSLSMPLIAGLAGLDETRLDRRFGSDMARIAQVLEAAQRQIAA